MGRWEIDAENVFPAYVEPNQFDYECPNCGAMYTLDRCEVGDFLHSDTTVMDVDCINCGDQINVRIRNERKAV